MTIRKNLYRNFGSILVIAVVLMIINFYATWREHSASEATQQAMEMAQACELVRNQMMQNRLDLRNFLLGDTAASSSMSQGISKLRDLIESAKSKATTDEQRSALVALSDAENVWARDFAAPLVEKAKQVSAGNITFAELYTYYLSQDPGSWLHTSTRYIDEAERITNQELKARKNDSTWTTRVSIGLSLVFLLVAVGVGIFISIRTANNITQPLQQLIAVAQDIGDSGDLEHKIEISREDEVGELARSFSGMVSYLKEMAHTSEAIAGGDLATEVRPRSDRDTLGHAFLRMTEGLRVLVSNVRESASQVAAASGQVANASEGSAKVSVQACSAIDEVTSTMHEMSINVQNMVRNTQMQASSVSETSASIDQMVASIQRVADTSKVLLDISNRSRQEAQSGIATMEKTTDGLNRINSSIQSSAEIIGVLDQRAENIGKIIEVIDDISEQTNLLALNAAIEAARAGEHGLGFAVVADEVRKLAEKSAQSTKEISELIQSIQKEASKAVENMDQSTTIVNEGLTLGTDLREALKRISTVVVEVNKFAQEIGSATTEQSHGSTQIAKATTRLNEITHEINSAVEEQASGTQAVVKAMERMRDLIQQTTSGSTELAASSEQMEKMSRMLLQVMDRFKLQAAEAANAARA